MQVLVTGRLPDSVLAMIEEKHSVEMNPENQPLERKKLLSGIPDKDGLLCMITDRVDAEVINHAPNLKIIANFGVGYNNIDIQAASARGILVTNTPDVLTDATADLTFALILAVARRLVEGDRITREGRFKFWAPMHFLGDEVSGKTLGLVGLGRIGKAVARRAAGFDMQVLYYQRHRLSPAEEKSLQVAYREFETLLHQSDFLSLHVPLTPATRHLIGAPELTQMKPSAYLINTSRGPVVDEKALLQALKNKQIRGAGLDVYENEPQLTAGLGALNNVVLLPHIGSATVETRTEMALTAAKNLLAGLNGEPPPNCVNLHELKDS
jgi:glyoxylate reductase